MHNFPLPCLVFCIWLPYTVSLWTSCYLILFPVFISLYADFPIFLSTVFLSPDFVTRLSLSIYDYLLSFCYFSLSWWFFPYLSLSLFKFPSLFYIISLTWFYITCLSHYMRLSTSYTLVSLCFYSLSLCRILIRTERRKTTQAVLSTSFCAISSRRFIMARRRSPAGLMFLSPQLTYLLFSALLSVACHFHSLYCIWLHSRVPRQMRGILHSPLSFLVTFTLRLLHLAWVRCIQKKSSNFVNVMVLYIYIFFKTSITGLFPIY